MLQFISMGHPHPRSGLPTFMYIIHERGTCLNGSGAPAMPILQDEPPLSSTTTGSEFITTPSAIACHFHSHSPLASLRVGQLQPKQRLDIASSLLYLFKIKSALQTACSVGDFDTRAMAARCREAKYIQVH